MNTLEELGYEKGSEDSNYGCLIYRKGVMVLVVNPYDMTVTKMAMVENVSGITYTYDELKAIVALLEEKR